MRKSVLTTSLSATLGSRVVVVPPTAEELLLRETEEKMIRGSDAGLFHGGIGRFFDIRFISSPPRYQHFVQSIGWDIWSTLMEAQPMKREYAAGDASLTNYLYDHFVIDLLYGTPPGSDEHAEQPRRTSTGHQRRPGRQATGPLRPGAVLQAARRRDGWHGCR